MWILGKFALAVFFSAALFSEGQLHEFFSKISEPILKTPKKHESQGFDTLHNGLRFSDRNSGNYWSPHLYFLESNFVI